MVRYLNYKNENITIRVSYSALKNFNEKTKKTVDDLNDDLSLLEPLLFYSMKSGYKAENKKMIYEFGDMADILDEKMNG